LARPPAQIKLSEILRLLEDGPMLVECVDNPGNCERSACCASRALWGEVSRAIDQVLESKTLADLREDCPEGITSG